MVWFYNSVLQDVRFHFITKHRTRANFSRFWARIYQQKYLRCFCCFAEHHHVSYAAYWLTMFNGTVTEAWALLPTSYILKKHTIFVHLYTQVSWFTIFWFEQNLVNKWEKVPKGCMWISGNQSKTLRRLTNKKQDEKKEIPLKTPQENKRKET